MGIKSVRASAKALCKCEPLWLWWSCELVCLKRESPPKINYVFFRKISSICPVSSGFPTCCCLSSVNANPHSIFYSFACWQLTNIKTVITDQREWTFRNYSFIFINVCCQSKDSGLWREAFEAKFQSFPMKLVKSTLFTTSGLSWDGFRDRLNFKHQMLLKHKTSFMTKVANFRLKSFKTWDPVSLEKTYVECMCLKVTQPYFPFVLRILKSTGLSCR